MKVEPGTSSMRQGDRVTGNKHVVSAATRRDTLATSVPHSQFSLATMCQLVTRVQPGQALWRDTGAAKAMIHRDLVPLEKVSSETVDIQCPMGT